MSITEMISSLGRMLKHPLNKNHPIKTILRVIWWKINQLFFHLPTIYQITPNRRCICYPNSSYGSMIVYSGIPEYEEVNYMLKTLKSNDNVIDIGAGIGDYALFASSIIIKGHIYAIEPFEKSIDLFEDNIVLNKLKNISIYKGVISNKNGYEYLSIENESEVNHIAYRGNISNSQKVKATTLDNYIKINNIKNVAFLKIDVEGAEIKVLEGASNSIKKAIFNNIIIELNSNNRHFGTSNTEIIKLLNKSNYKTYQIKNGKLARISHRDINDESIVNIICKKG